MAHVVRRESGPVLSLQGGIVGRAARVLGVPAGTGELIDLETRRRLLISIGGAVVLSLLDMLGVLAMLPMMQYVTGQDPDAGALGAVNDAPRATLRTRRWSPRWPVSSSARSS